MSEVVAFIFASISTLGLLQPCSTSGLPGWSSQVRDVVPDCDVSISSPDGRLVLHVDKNQMEVRRANGGSVLRGSNVRLEPPAVVSWSPRSDYFFVNDGHSSGQTSVLRVFPVDGDNANEESKINSNALAAFRGVKRCESTAEPSVWGFGWSPSGDSLYLFVEAGPHATCRPLTPEFVTWVARVADGTLVERVSLDSARKRFASLLPPQLLAK